MTKKVGVSIILWSWALIIVVTFSLWIFSKSFFLSKSYLLGSITSLMLFTMLLSKAKEMEETKAQKKYNILGMIIRYSLAAIILAVGVFDERFSAIVVFLGLLTVKIVVLLYGFIKLKKVVV